MSNGGQDLSGFSMLDLFRTEVETQAAILTEGLLVLERDASATRQIEPLMRASHSIKGAARIVGLDHAVAVAHVMEDCFVAAQEEAILLGQEHIDALLQGVDLLARISQLDEAGSQEWLSEHQPEIDQLVAKLSELRTQTAAAPEAGAPVSAPPETVSESPAGAPQTPVAEVPAGVEEPVEASTRPPAGRDRVVRVTADNLNRLMGLAGESLVEARWLQPFETSLMRLKVEQVVLSEQLEQLQETLGDSAGPVHSLLGAMRLRIQHLRQMAGERLVELDVYARRSENLSDRLYREVIASRMRPFTDGTQGFPRMVRDVSRRLGKKVRLVISGQSTDVDRDILEKLEAPLNHILRNAVDHGIELPDERRAAGKPEEGTIQLGARHMAGLLVIAVSDDGRGIDLARLRAKIVRKGLATEEMAAQMNETELLEFLFLPGFSTSEQVTEISGRGVGLDVVHSMVQEVGGTVRIQSESGKGTTFRLQLPLTLSVIRTLLVEIGGEPYAFPLVRVDRILRVPLEQVEIVEDRQFFTLDNEKIGLISASQVLELQTATALTTQLPVVVISERSSHYGVVVDSFLGERDLVVQSLDRRLGKIPNISVAALMEDGSPVLILDVDDLIRTIDNLLLGKRLKKLAEVSEEAAAERQKRVLVVDDSITVREVERTLLENRGYKVETAVDGMDGWNAVRTGQYDLVVTDVDMPRMNGIDLVRHIRRDPRLQALPVMIVSYKDREQDRMQGLEAGASYYLTKSSFHDETLLTAVSDLIGEAEG